MHSAARPARCPVSAGDLVKVDATTHANWLADTRRFWDAGSEFEARYRRICCTPDFAATEDETTITGSSRSALNSASDTRSGCGPPASAPGEPRATTPAGIHFRTGVPMFCAIVSF